MARPKMRKDLTGMRFGHLTAISVDEERTKDGKVYWLCKCDCGNNTSVLSTSLTRENNGTKSCGCARNSEDAKKKAKITRESYPQDITGIRFGRLVVTRKTNIKSDRSYNNGAYLWECKCDCGNTCYYSRYSLISPYGVRSCGCLYNDARFECTKKYCDYDLDNYDFGIGYCSNGTYFFFDKEDYDKIKDYSWWYDGRYVIAHTLKNDKYTTDIIRMHRVVMDIDDREDINVDHKNLIRYDCRKCNLRRATDSENAMNKDYSYMSTTGVTGVTKYKDKWRASIKIKKKTINLGTFDSFDKAVIARRKAEDKLFGEFKFDLSNKDIIDELNLEKYRNYKNVI
jgi:hypothetical protein